MRITTRALVAAVVVGSLAVLAVGCGGGGSGDAAAGPIDQVTALGDSQVVERLRLLG
jgi:hypothetical protein